MIVRILTEGQFQLKSENLDKLNKIDNEIVNAVAASNDVRYSELFEEMLRLVRQEGTALSPEVIAESDLILPPPDTTLSEARAIFTGAGLVPD